MNRDNLIQQLVERKFSGEKSKTFRGCVPCFGRVAEDGRKPTPPTKK